MIFGLLYFCVVILCVNRSRTSFILYRIVKRHSRQSNVRRIWACADNETWCEENLPNFIGKHEWPGNTPDLNCIENLWSILDSEAYKDPRPSTMPQLRRRLQCAWRTIPLQHVVSLIHSMPNRIKNVIKNKGGPPGY